MQGIKFAHTWISRAIADHNESEALRPDISRAPDLKFGKSAYGTRLCIKGRVFEHGLGTIGLCAIPVKTPMPAKKLQAVVGIDENRDTVAFIDTPARIVFSVESNGKELWSSSVMTVADEPIAVDCDLGGVTEFTLKTHAPDGRSGFGFADWADAKVTLTNGSEIWLGESIPEQRLHTGMPLTFTYDDCSSREFLDTWQVTRASRRASDDVTIYEITYRDPQTGLEFAVEMKQFDDFPAVEWVAHFKNTGRENTPIIEDIRAIDMSWEVHGDVFLHSSNGAGCGIDDFMYKADPIAPASSVYRSGRGSSSEMPFFNVQTGDDGVLVALGWSGQWAVDFNREDEDVVKITGGMEKTHLTLYPGEEIRTPSALLVFWRGEPIDGNNVLRRFIIKHHTPIIDGKPIVAPICNGTWGGMKSEAHLDRIKAVKDYNLEYDYYWIDAGWYGLNSSYSPDEFTGDWGVHVGDWRVNVKAHPKGLKPLADAAHEAGMKFLLWVEPQRAISGTPITQEHPEWFLGERKVGQALLLNIGIPEAREYVTDLVSNLITEIGIDCYREDFNINPLSFWQTNDAEDRQGMTEIRCIEGFYAFWDELLKRHPNLMIDNCASGGRRIDIETISRSIALWRSDYQCFPHFDPIGGQVQTYGLSHWVPLHTTGTMMRAGDTYNFRSNMAAGIVFHLFPYEKTHIDEAYPWEWHKKMTGELRRARPYFYGDYFPLTSCSTSHAEWLAYQLYRSDLGKGVVVAFRREKSPFIQANFKLRGIELGSTYVLEDADTGETMQMTGEALASKGLSITVDNRRESKLIFYEKTAQ
ncbi:MAG: alpha-galactosidase [Armatimonadota bacterium]